MSQKKVYSITLEVNNIKRFTIYKTPPTYSFNSFVFNTDWIREEHQHYKDDDE